MSPIIATFIGGKIDGVNVVAVIAPRVPAPRSCGWHRTSASRFCSYSSVISILVFNSLILLIKGRDKSLHTLRRSPSTPPASFVAIGALLLCHPASDRFLVKTVYPVFKYSIIFAKYQFSLTRHLQSLCHWRDGLHVCLPRTTSVDHLRQRLIEYWKYLHTFCLLTFKLALKSWTTQKLFKMGRCWFYFAFPFCSALSTLFSLFRSVCVLA